MSNTPGIDELRELMRQLSLLLDDPHPGLFTWKESLSHYCLEIGDFGGIGYVSAMPALLAACKEARTELLNQRNVDADIWPILDKAIAKAEPQPQEEP